ncbi:MAG: hypothetical protein ACHQAX_00660 [Gammaproteobacteria bacterium]
MLIPFFELSTYDDRYSVIPNRITNELLITVLPNQTYFGRTWDSSYTGADHFLFDCFNNLHPPALFQRVNLNSGDAKNGVKAVTLKANEKSHLEALNGVIDSMITRTAYRYCISNVTPSLNIEYIEDASSYMSNMWRPAIQLRLKKAIEALQARPEFYLDQVNNESTNEQRSSRTMQSLTSQSICLNRKFEIASQAFLTGIKLHLSAEIMITASFFAHNDYTAHTSRNESDCYLDCYDNKEDIKQRSKFSSLYRHYKFSCRLSPYKETSLYGRLVEHMNEVGGSDKHSFKWMLLKHIGNLIVKEMEKNPSIDPDGNRYLINELIHHGIIFSNKDVERLINTLKINLDPLGLHPFGLPPIVCAQGYVTDLEDGDQSDDGETPLPLGLGSVRR